MANTFGIRTCNPFFSLYLISNIDRHLLCCIFIFILLDSEKTQLIKMVLAYCYSLYWPVHIWLMMSSTTILTTINCDYRDHYCCLSFHEISRSLLFWGRIGIFGIGQKATLSQKEKSLLVLQASRQLPRYLEHSQDPQREVFQFHVLILR